MAVFLVVFVFLLASYSLNSTASPFKQTESAAKYCIHQGEPFLPGMKFADKSCDGWCECTNTGFVACVSLCPLTPRPKCRWGWILSERDVPSVDPTGRCKCRQELCIPSPPPPPPPQEFVVPECRNRKTGEWFVNESCTGRCRCKGGGISCVSLCPPVAVRCPLDQVREAFEEEMDSENRCSCKRERCVSKMERWRMEV